jgi:putative aminopeptidase FrvX
MTNKKFLEDYINGYSAVGYESNGQRIWANYVAQYVDKIYDDNYGNVIAVINPTAEYKVVLDAHADEICWYINHIDKDGLLYVKRNGGTDVQIAPSKDVVIFTQDGKQVPGVFGWLAVHLRHDAQKDLKPELEKLWIDVGAKDDKDVEKMGIQIGDVAIFNDKFRILNEDKWVGRSLDDKIGGYINAQVVRQLSENKDKLPFGLYIVNSVQEEIGLRGAEMAAQSIKPNVAIAFDPTHATNIPHVSAKTEGDNKFGDGVVFCQAPVIHKKLNQIMMDVAKENDIKFKLNIRPTATGTNSDSYTYSNGGVVTGLISIPLKYMHCTCEMVQESDVEDAIKLIYNIVKKLENNQDFRYLKL